MRMGGRYRITDTAVETLRHLNSDLKAKLTTWVVDQRRFGEPLPVINSNVIDACRTRRPLRFSEKKERFFLCLAAIGFRPGYKIGIGIRTGGIETSPQLMAWLEMEQDELLGFVTMLADAGLLKPINTGPTYLVATLSARGFDQLEASESGAVASNQGFIAMWFGSEMDAAFTHGMEPALLDAGYRAFRIDRKEHNNPIDDEIIAEIRRSRFLLADFTCPVFDVAGTPTANSRGGVYYEAGFAQGFGIPVFWSCREDMIAHLHFDTRQMPHMTWKTPEELREKVYNRVAAVLGTAPGAPGKGATVL